MNAMEIGLPIPFGQCDVGMRINICLAFFWLGVTGTMGFL
jgi:hypothetical protein